jgi:deoxyribodipyrimidine photolyase-related protein
MQNSKTKIKTLRLILGDQLNLQHSWFKTVNSDVTYVLMEIRSETDYAWHHIQKVAGFFAAMQQFAKELQDQNHQVVYIKLNDKSNLQAFDKNCKALINKHQFTEFQYQLPDEYRVDEHLKTFTTSLTISSQVVDSEHFLSTRNELGEFFKGKKTYLMESFYRYMRKKHHVLMNGNDPLTGKWNYDEDNRKKLPATHKATTPFIFSNDVAEISNELKKANIKTIGNIDSKNFIWPISRVQSLQLLDFFVTECLPLFGTYQDAMTPNDWSLYHSRLSFSLNTKLISPLEVINKAIDEWKKRPNDIEYNQLEGFVRQIIGWREYMRGIYWQKMPEYATLNYFNHQNKLPNGIGLVKQK